METQITKEAVLKAVENYTGDYTDHKKRQARLKVMIEEHGVELTALACGLIPSTLIQYARLKTAPAINENSVLKGERIFEQLSTEK